MKRCARDGCEEFLVELDDLLSGAVKYASRPYVFGFYTRDFNEVAYQVAVQQRMELCEELALARNIRAKQEFEENGLQGPETIRRIVQELPDPPSIDRETYYGPWYLKADTSYCSAKCTILDLVHNHMEREDNY